MAKDASFDIVSDFDGAKMQNALEQVQREIANRYDFKGTSASITFTDASKQSAVLVGDNDFQVDAILDSFRQKVAAAGIDQHVLDPGEAIQSGMSTKQTVTFKRGISQDDAKKITAHLRQQLPKLKSNIQGDSIRVTGAKRDELQAAINYLKAEFSQLPLQFTNYR